MKEIFKNSCCSVEFITIVNVFTEYTQGGERTID
jgi:hypothetical protein